MVVRPTGRPGTTTPTCSPISSANRSRSTLPLISLGHSHHLTVRPLSASSHFWDLILGAQNVYLKQRHAQKLGPPRMPTMSVLYHWSSSFRFNEATTAFSAILSAILPLVQNPFLSTLMLGLTHWLIDWTEWVLFFILWIFIVYIQRASTWA